MAGANYPTPGPGPKATTLPTDATRGASAPALVKQEATRLEDREPGPVRIALVELFAGLNEELADWEDDTPIEAAK